MARPAAAVPKDGGCHCLCSHNHPEALAVCEGHQATALIFWLPDELAEAHDLWSVEVPLCRACLLAWVEAARMS
jgi:hypothetical protein